MSVPQRRCGNCAKYYITRNWEKVCAEEVFRADGKRRIKVKNYLGMMGDCKRACEEWKPSDGYLRLQNAQNNKRKEH